MKHGAHGVHGEERGGVFGGGKAWTKGSKKRRESTGINSYYYTFVPDFI